MPKKAHSTIKHSFIFPVCNEAIYLPTQLESFYQFLKQKRFTQFEILLIGNGSTNQTWINIKKLTKKYQNLRSLRICSTSHGQTIKHGILSALGQSIYILNINSFNTDFISQARKLLNKYQVVVGLETNNYQRNWLQCFQTKIFYRLLKTFFTCPNIDPHGPKAFRRTSILVKTLRNCAAKHELLDTELLLKLYQQTQSLKEIPIIVKRSQPICYISQRKIRAILIDLYRLITFYSINLLNKKTLNQQTTISITADDYGLSPITNEAILNQVRAKNLDRVSVLANLISQSSSQKLLSLKQQIKIGLHFNLTRGKPITQAKLVSSLVDSHGNFFSLPIFLIKLWLGNIKLVEVKLELINQLEYLKSLKIFPKYLDSEQHIHIFNPLNGLIIQFANQHKLQIRSIASTISYLSFRPHKYLIFSILQIFFCLKNIKFISLKQKKSGLSFETKITHPGNLYD